MWLLSLLIFFFSSNQWGELAQSASSLQDRRGNGERYRMLFRKRENIRGRERLEIAGYADRTERSLKQKEMGRKRKEQAEPERFSFFILSALLSPLFVSSSTLCSEQGSQGHLAGCEAWGWISIRALWFQTHGRRVKMVQITQPEFHFCCSFRLRKYRWS